MAAATAAVRKPQSALGKTDLNYAKWDHLDSDEEEAERDREREKRLAERKAKGIPTEAEKFDREAAGGGPVAEDPAAQKAAQIRDVVQGFDPASHQQDRIAHLEAMREMKQSANSTGGERLDHVELHNEQLLRDAKQQGRQGNCVFGDDGKVRILSDDNMGGKTGKYWWGQNNTEVTLKCHVAAGLKSKAVQLTTASQRVRLVVDGEVICEGALFRSIISDESTFSLEDTPGGRLLTVTLLKAKETSGKEHWTHAIKGEARADVSKFGMAIKTINPYDRDALKHALD